MSHTEAFEQLLRSGFVWFAESGAQASANALLSQDHRGIATTEGGATQFGLEPLDQSLPAGLKWSAVHEFMHGDYPPLSLMALLASRTIKLRQTRKLVIWIGARSWPTPFILQQINSELLCTSIFIDPPGHRPLLWAIETALRSHAGAAVIAACARISPALSRRFSLAAASSGALGLILRPYKSQSVFSAAASRWRVESAPSKSRRPCLAIQLLKMRGEQPTQRSWIVETPSEPDLSETASIGDVLEKISVHTSVKLSARAQ